MNQVAGVVVWYNPTDEHIKNIESYIDNIDELYIFDNSSVNNEYKIKKMNESKQKIKYVSFGKNFGVSYALNYGAKIAIKNKKKWILTMDQDSYFEKKTFKNFFKENLLEDEDVGIYAPVYNYDLQVSSLKTEKSKKEIEKVITSGNLVNLKIYIELGGFEEEFFIDEIDHDYCLRLRKNKKKIYEINDVILHHSLGEKKNKNFFIKKIKYTEHNSFRKYNIWKNKISMIRKYPCLKYNYTKFFIKDFFKILLLENNKKEKIKMIKKAIKDSKNVK